MALSFHRMYVYIEIASYNGMDWIFMVIREQYTSHKYKDKCKNKELVFASNN